MKTQSLYKWYVLFILILVYTTNIGDRFVLSILIEPIRAEFGVSDTALGFLSGFAFAVFYTLMGLPIAWLADRSNRRNIIALAVGAYSIMTVLCGAAQSFSHLLLARIGVGVGEAGASPPSHSLLSDMFPVSQRAFVLATLSLGASIGLIVGLSGGGWIAENYGWRYAFYAMAIPGVVVALLVRFTIREPIRSSAGDENERDNQAAKVPGVAETFKLIASQKAYLHIIFGGYLLNAYMVGMSVFLPAVLVRSHGYTVGEGWSDTGLDSGNCWFSRTAGGWLYDRLSGQPGLSLAFMVNGMGYDHYATCFHRLVAGWQGAVILFIRGTVRDCQFHVSRTTLCHRTKSCRRQNARPCSRPAIIFN